MLWAVNPVAEKTVAPVAEKTTVCVFVVRCRAPVVGGGVLHAATRRVEVIRVASTRDLAVARLNSAHIMQPLSASVADGPLASDCPRPTMTSERVYVPSNSSPTVLSIGEGTQMIIDGTISEPRQRRKGGPVV
jgi:hypothetical protein